jgi:hypothetical protein
MAASVITTLIGIVAAASSKVLADEFKAWSPRMTKRLIALAIRSLPEEQCERYSEEWLSYVEEIPGELGKLFAAVGLLWAGIKLRSVLRRGSRTAMVAKKNEFNRRSLLSQILDIAAFACSVFLAFELRFDGTIPTQLDHPMFITMFILVGLQSAAFLACRVYWDRKPHTHLNDLVRISVAVMAGSIAGVLVIVLLLGPWYIPCSVYILDLQLALLLTSGGRLAVRIANTDKMPIRPEGS